MRSWSATAHLGTGLRKIN